MNIIYKSAFALALSCSGIMAAQAHIPLKAKNHILIDEKGMTVYTFDKDTAGDGKSTCYQDCAALWPAVKADKADAAASAKGDYSLITRTDGTQQWAYKGKPLYLFSKDKKAGDRLGDNVKDIWHVVSQ